MIGWKTKYKSKVKVIKKAKKWFSNFFCVKVVIVK